MLTEETRPTPPSGEPCSEPKAQPRLWNRVASHCCVCGLPLVDATSVEFGIGPVCRRKYNYEDAYPITPAIRDIVSEYAALNLPLELAERLDKACENDDSRKAANLVVYFASAEQGEAAVKAAHVLRVLGYNLLAERITERLCEIKIERLNGNLLFVKSPYSPVFVSAIKAQYIVGRMWDGANKGWILPDTYEAFLLLDRALKVAYPGALVDSPVGNFSL